MKYEGHNGQIEVVDEALVITREGLVGRTVFGKDFPPRRVPLGAVTAVGIKPASRMTNGNLSLGLQGKQLAVGNSANSDQDSVIFTHKQKDAFEALHTWLLTVVAANVQSGVDALKLSVDGGGLSKLKTKLASVESWSAEQKARAEGATAARSEAQEAKAREATKARGAKAAGRLSQANARYNPDGNRADIAEAAARMRWTMGGKRELKKLSEHVLDSETVRYIAQGTYQDKQGIVVLTDQRLVFIFHGLTQAIVEDFNLASITNVASKVGMGTGTLIVHVAGAATHIRGIVKADLSYLLDALRKAVTERGQPQPFVVQQAPVDVADQLMKLAALRDQGILSAEEFDGQKTKLLGM